MENLEKVISRPGKVCENIFYPKSFLKVLKMCNVHLRSFIKRIHIFWNIYSLNQTIVSHVYTEILQNVWSRKCYLKSFTSIGQHVHDPWRLYFSMVAYLAFL